MTRNGAEFAQKTRSYAHYNRRLSLFVHGAALMLYIGVFLYNHISGRQMTYLKADRSGMYLGLEQGDVIVWRSATNIGRGDMIRFRATNKDGQNISLYSRIIGLPEEVIYGGKGGIVVNGAALVWPYLIDKNVVPFYHRTTSTQYLIALDQPVQGKFVIGPIEKSDVVAQAENYYAAANFWSRNWMDFVYGGMLLLGLVFMPAALIAICRGDLQPTWVGYLYYFAVFIIVFIGVHGIQQSNSHWYIYIASLYGFTSTFLTFLGVDVVRSQLFGIVSSYIGLISGIISIGSFIRRALRD